MSGTSHYAAVLIGGSAGAIEALLILLKRLPGTFRLPLVVVLHRLEESGGPLHRFFDRHCALPVIEIQDKEPLRPGQVYLAPRGYHALLEEPGHFGLSIDPRVNYSRPSIDVLFESAVDLFADRTIGIILTGANSDGASGLQSVEAAGGLALVQDPAGAVADFMPRAALKATPDAWVLGLDGIAEFLAGLDQAEDVHDLLARCGDTPEDG